jgi:serine phosphatase RsbU (regulator of sigma subunit)
VIDNRVPELPAPWRVETALAAAGGADVAGDFVVGETRADGTVDLVVADVSGRGAHACDLAHELDGVMRQALSDRPAAEFLPTVNAELAARDWGEGFATAVHVALDPGTGRYDVRSAGHPAPAHHADGAWRLLPCEGPILGLLPEASYAVRSGRIGAGEALLLYTDGMVEEPGRDIDRGVDRLLAAAGAPGAESYAGLADRLLATVGTSTDDRAVLVLHRS